MGEGKVGGNIMLCIKIKKNKLPGTYVSVRILKVCLHYGHVLCSIGCVSV